MPIPEWIDLPPLDRYTSRLPEAYPGAPTTPTGVPVEWAQRSVEAVTMLAGHLVQNVAIGRGWSAPLGELDALVTLAKRVAQGGDDPLAILGAVRDLMKESDLIRSALAAPLREVQRAITDGIAAGLGVVTLAAEVVPIIGWAIMAIRFFVQAHRVRYSGETFGVSDLTEGFNTWEIPKFSRGLDDDAANDMLDVLATGDWTRVWMPNTAPWDKGALNFGGVLKGGHPKLEGWIFGAGLGGLEFSGFSCVPGVAQMGAAFYGPVDFIPDGRRNASDIVPVRSTSDVWPSLIMLSGLAWARLQVPSGQCCSVDLDAVDYAWGIWQGRGREWLETTAMQPPAGGGSRNRQINALRTMAKGALGLRYDDNGSPIRTDLYPGANGRAGSRKAVREMVYEATAALRQKIHRNLGTIACAYVPPEAPALRDVNLKLRYAAMRNALLKHRARYDVELDLVPDAYYRNALRDSRMKLAAPDVAQRRRGGTIDGSPEAPPPQLPGVPGGGGTEGGEDLTGLLVLAALAAAAALL